MYLNEGGISRLEASWYYEAGVVCQSFREANSIVKSKVWLGALAHFSFSRPLFSSSAVNLFLHLRHRAVYKCRIVFFKNINMYAKRGHQASAIIHHLAEASERHIQLIILFRPLMLVIALGSAHLFEPGGALWPLGIQACWASVGALFGSIWHGPSALCRLRRRCSMACQASQKAARISGRLARRMTNRLLASV